MLFMNKLNVPLELSANKKYSNIPTNKQTNVAKNHHKKKTSSSGSPRGVMVKELDCVIVVRKFEFRACYYAHFQTNIIWKCVTPFIFPSMCQIASQLGFSKKKKKKRRIWY